VRRITPSEQRNILVLLIIVLVFILAMTIALGKVEKDTSYGLEDAIRFLTILGAGLAFGRSGDSTADK
jgi:hypothetical protein